MASSQKKKKTRGVASGNTGLGTFAKPSQRAKAILASTTAAKAPAPFIRGSLNDQLSRLEVGQSLGEALRLPLNEDYQKNGSSKSQEWFKNRNSVISGAIAKVRGVAAHKGKKFKMERGSFATNVNDAMIFFICTTRTE